MLMSLVLANLKLIYRDRQAGFWAIAFPLIFLLIFGLFNFDDLEPLLHLQGLGTRGKPVGYFDFLLPGIIGMGVMTFSIIGMGTTIAQYRQQRILRRIQTTPLKVQTFFIGQVLAWLILSLVQTAIIMIAGIVIFRAAIYGNYISVFPLVVLANLTFLNLGFIVGSLSKSVQAASGLGNLLTMPLMFLSGVFFPTDNLPSIMALAVKYLPLTPLLEALRGVLLTAQPLSDFPTQLVLLGSWVVITGMIAVKTFKFE